MPPTARDGILFISDEQGFADLDAMVDSFTAWGETFAPAQVGFQYGYFADRPWWIELDDLRRTSAELCSTHTNRQACIG